MREFYKTILPEIGKYFVVTIEKKGEGKPVVVHKTADGIDEVVSIVDKEKSVTNRNVYVAAGSFGEGGRKADNCTSVRSFFFDLDCKGDGADNSYGSKEEALSSLKNFISTVGFPNPVLVDSGNGLWAYWPLTESIDKEEWVSTAEKLKALCSALGFVNDPSVPADCARIVRCPDTTNWNGPPKPTKLLTKLKQFDYEDIKSRILAASEKAGLVKKESGLEGYIRSDISEEVKEYIKSKYDDFETNFKKILSLGESGCNQINYIALNQADCSEPLWRGGLSVAWACEDKEKAIHAISKRHPEYSHAETDRKARETKGPYTCKTFADINPKGCEGCIHLGKKTSPIQLGRELKKSAGIKVEPKVLEAKVEPPSSPSLDFPPELYPYTRGPNGGIYFQPEPEFNKETKKKVYKDAIKIYPYDIEVYDRYTSRHDGETLAINIHLPQDPVKEFYIPLKTVSALDKFREVMSMKSVVVNNKNCWEHLMAYVQKWSAYLTSVKAAKQLREQLGWSDDGRSFALGHTEYFPGGVEKHCPPSDTTRKIAAWQHTKGSFDLWKDLFNHFGKPGYETHALFALAGFGTPLMQLSGSHGVVMNAFSKGSGTGKTLAIKAALSIWGNPTDLMVTQTTENARLQRVAVLRSTPYANDEQTNIPDDKLSELIYGISLGKTKVRMNASSNTEREDFGPFNTMGLMNSNECFYEKLARHRGSAQGESARLIQFDVDTPPGMDWESTKESLDKLNHNYGFAGRVFIRYVVDNYDEVEALVHSYSRTFNREFRAESKDRYWVNWVGAMMAGGEIAKKLGLHNLDMDKVYRHIIKKLREVQGRSLEYVMQASDLLGTFIAKNTSNMLVIDSTIDKRKGSVSMELPMRTPMNFRGLVIRYEPDQNRTYIVQSDLIAYLKDKKFSTREFENTLKASGVLVEQKKYRMTKGWDVAPQNPVMVYIFDYTVNIEEESQEGTQGEVRNE